MRHRERRCRAGGTASRTTADSAPAATGNSAAAARSRATNRGAASCRVSWWPGGRGTGGRLRRPAACIVSMVRSVSRRERRACRAPRGGGTRGSEGRNASAAAPHLHVHGQLGRSRRGCLLVPPAPALDDAGQPREQQVHADVDEGGGAVDLEGVLGAERRG